MSLRSVAARRVHPHHSCARSTLRCLQPHLLQQWRAFTQHPTLLGQPRRTRPLTRTAAASPAAPDTLEGDGRTSARGPYDTAVPKPPEHLALYKHFAEETSPPDSSTDSAVESNPLFANASDPSSDDSSSTSSTPDLSSPYDYTDPHDTSVHHNSVLSKLPQDDVHFVEWKLFRDVDGSVDESVIAVVDSMESIMSFESDGETRAIPLRVYWGHLSHLLGFAYRSGNHRAQHALETYRYRGREFVRALSESAPNPAEPATILSTLIGCIANSARDTLQVLSSRLDIPFYARADSCYHLRHIPARWAEISNDPQLEQLYHQSLEPLRDRDTWESMAEVKTRHMALMMEHLHREDAVQLLSDWRETFPYLRDGENLWLMDQYTRLGDADNALQALGKVSKQLLQKPNYDLIARCVNLLKLDSIEDRRKTQSFRILPSMLKLGLPPLDIIHNMAVQNTARSGMQHVSLDLYEALQAQGRPVHNHTTAALLKQSLKSGNYKVMNKVMTMIQTREDLTHDPFVMSVMLNVVRHICFFQQGLGSDECLAYLLAIYDRAYSRGILGRIGILGPDQARGGNPTHPEPHPVALTNFIWSFILAQTQEARVRGVWLRIVQILRNGRLHDAFVRVREPLLREAMRDGAVFRAFLIFYQRNQATLPDMIDVLKYMLRNAPESVEEPEWIIVVNGFMRHMQHKNIDIVQQLMRNFASEAPTPSRGNRLRAFLERWPEKARIARFVKDLEAGLALGADKGPGTIAV